MKVLKKILGVLLMAMFALTLIFSVSTVSKAEGYTVTISLGDVDEATFDISKLLVNDAAATGIKIDKRNGDIEYLLTISNLSYGDKISFKADELIKIKNPETSKNYVKGIRIGGADALVNKSNPLNIELTVKENASYVAAYGVGSVKEYLVEYLCSTTGSEKVSFNDKESLYSAISEPVAIPSRHYEGYLPTGVKVTVNGVEKVKGADFTVSDVKVEVDKKDPPTIKDVITETTINSLEEKTVVQFTYEPINPYIDTKIDYDYSTVTLYGPTQYTYEYQYIDGQPQIRTTTNPGTTVVNNRRETNQNQAAEGGNNAAVGEVNGNGAAGGGNDTTTISDGETPLAGDSNGETTIPEPETPKRVEPIQNGGISAISRVVVTVTVITLIVLVLITVATYIVRRRNYK